MVDRNPLITVFTSSYNAERKLHRVYESLDRQTLREFEWLVVDDGSTDGTVKLVEEWQAHATFPIRLERRTHAGTAASFNHAVSLARGELFFQIDHDDGCRPNALERIWESWCEIPENDRSGYAAIYVRSCDENGRPNGPGFSMPRRDATYHEQHYRYGVREDQRPCWVTDVIRRFPAPILKSFSGWLPEGLTQARVGRMYTARWLNEILYVYHQADHSRTSVSTSGSRFPHWPGLREQYREQLAFDARWLRYAPLMFCQRAAAYVRFSLRLRLGLRAQWAEMKTGLARTLWLMAVPAGIAFNLMDRARTRSEVSRRSSKPAKDLARVLYVTYDGLLEPLGQSQVLPYLRRLARDSSITVMSFEKRLDWADRQRRQEQREQLANAGIEWIPLRYHKRPSLPATAYDIVHGMVRGIGTAMRRTPEIVHVRGYVPGVIGLATARAAGARFIFDMRGFWPDEKVDAGAWRLDSDVYRAAKWFEKKLLTRADVVVSLTRAGVDEMKKFPYLRGRNIRFEVIPTCTDLELFRPAATRNGNERRGFVLGYVGSVGTFYLFDEVLECFKVLLEERPDARLLIVNRGGHAYIRARMAALGVPSRRVELHAAEYREVPEYIRKMDAGAFFIRPTFSKKSSAPTRLGEFLGCGVPCLVNAGVGDVDAVVSGCRVGVVMRDFTAEARRATLQDLLKLCADRETALRCVEAARRCYWLDDGVAAYGKLYRDLAGQAIAPGTPRARRAPSCAE